MVHSKKKFSVKLRIASDYSHQPTVHPRDLGDLFHAAPISPPTGGYAPILNICTITVTLVRPSPVAPAMSPFPRWCFLYQEVKSNHVLLAAITQLS